MDNSFALSFIERTIVGGTSTKRKDFYECACIQKSASSSIRKLSDKRVAEDTSCKCQQAPTDNFPLLRLSSMENGARMDAVLFLEIILADN